MLKLILLIIIVQIISNDASPFPEDMYHGKEPVDTTEFPTNSMIKNYTN